MVTGIEEDKAICRSNSGLASCCILWLKQAVRPCPKAMARMVVPSIHEGKLLADTSDIGPMLDDEPLVLKLPGFI